VLVLQLPPLHRCPRSSVAACPSCAALPPCRMRVLPPAWCRRCQGSAACCCSRSALATASHLHSRHRSPMPTEASAAVGLHTCHAQSCARLLLVLLPAPLLRCSHSSAAYPPRTDLPPCRMRVMPPAWQGAGQKKKPGTPVVSGWVKVRKRTRVRLFFFDIFLSCF
jgi:hypothetical protein